MFPIHWPAWVQFTTSDTHTMLLNICEFHRNQGREGQTVLIDINK